jgi:hypothetical protein
MSNHHVENDVKGRALGGQFILYLQLIFLSICSNIFGISYMMWNIQKTFKLTFAYLARFVHAQCAYVK